MDNSKKKNILLGLLIVGVISMTVAFAALSTNLRLNGTANVAATRWNIHFKEWHKVTTITEVTNGGQTHTNTAQAPSESDLTMEDNTNVTKVSGVNVTLNQPGDTAKYTFQIINEGTIDAKLDNFTATNTTNNDLVDYDVKCYTQEDEQGTEVTQNSVLSANNGTIYCYMQVTYKDQSNSHTAGSNQVYHQNQISTNLTAQWTWVQNDGSSAQSGGGNSGSTPAGNYVAYKWSDSTTEGYSEAGEYHDNSYWFTSLNPNAQAYVRTDGTTPEICGVFSSGTVCLTSSYYNSNYSSAESYASDFENVTEYYGDVTTAAGLQETGLKGYALTKATEMLTKGASLCSVDSNYVSCSNINEIPYCDIFSEGNVSCAGGDDSNSYVNSNGTVY